MQRMRQPRRMVFTAFVSRDDERRRAVGKEPVTAEGYAIFVRPADAPKVGRGWREAWGIPL